MQWAGGLQRTAHRTEAPVVLRGCQRDLAAEQPAEEARIPVADLVGDGLDRRFARRSSTCSSGPFHNPRDFAPATGFYDGASLRVLDMLRMKDVSEPAPRKRLADRLQSAGAGQ